VDFDAYVIAQRAGLVRSAVLMGCPQADAEDVVQAALLRCYRHWRKVQRAERPEAYIYKILVNVLRQARNRRWHGEVPTEHLPDAVVDSEATTGLVVRAVLRRMRPEHRDVLVLRYYVDLSEADIAAILGLPVGTVKSRASRALQALAQDESLRSHDG
jgi:RNA polymerase sigma-70 factor (sigma-E family)